MNAAYPTKKLGELCHIARGGSPRPIQSYLTSDATGINWVKISDATASDKYIEFTKEKIRPEGLKKSRLVKAGDFILSNSMSFGRPYIMKTTGCIHDGWLVLSDKCGLFDQDYLYHFLGSDAAYRQFDRLAAGSTVRNLNSDLVKTVDVPLPPLEEQRRIVAVLDDAFAAIATATVNAVRNLANARELYSAILEAELKASGGTSTTLGEATSIKVGFAFKSGGYTSDPVDIPLIRGDNVVQGGLRWDNLKRWPQSDADAYGEYQLAAGDVVLAMDRTWVKSGLKYAVISEADLPCLLLQRVARLRAKVCTSSAFISLQIASAAFTDYILGIQTGLGVPHVSGKQIADFQFIMPNVERQANIVSKLQGAEITTRALAKAYSSRITLLNELKQSMLHRAFTGEVTAIAQETLAA